MLISERIYRLLEEKKISQIEFSRKTGISQSTISDWRRKGTNPSADKIMIICEALDVTPYDLLLDIESVGRREPNCVIIDKESKEFQLIEEYQKLNSDAKRRLEGYLKALTDMK